MVGILCALNELSMVPDQNEQSQKILNCKFYVWPVTLQYWNSRLDKIYEIVREDLNDLIF